MRARAHSQKLVHMRLAEHNELTSVFVGPNLIDSLWEPQEHTRDHELLSLVLAAN